MLYRMLVVFVLSGCLMAEGSPWGAGVVSYQGGTNADPGYDNPATALGEPSRTTAGWPSGDTDVTMFNSAWRTDQLVSIGAGGHLIVEFDHQVENDPANPFGIDLLVFGNATFSDSSYPTGVAGGIWSEAGKIAVSQDNVVWYEIVAASADDAFPTQGFNDTSGPYAADGSVISDFTKPVDPGIVWTGKTYDELIDLYAGSGGGAGIDIGVTGLDWIRYVKVHQDVGDAWSTDIDAFADVAPVPEPTTGVLITALAGLFVRLRTSRRVG